MPTPLLSYPFRLALSGDAATVEAESDAQLAEELAVAVLTRPEEREYLEGFGVADPVFAGFDLDALRLHVSLHGPDVDVDALSIDFVNDSTQEVTVTFSNNE